MAKYSHILTEKADADLEEIFEYTFEKFGLNQAINYLINIKETFIKIEHTPQIGRIRNELKKGLYSFPISSHIIFYRLLNNQIVIIRVLFAGRDLSNII